MTDPHSERRNSWTPPKRPDWVARINEEGSYMEIKHVVPLDESSLLHSARASTGLTDFGEDDWHEPFQVLIKSLDEESDLNLMGRLMTRSELLYFLEARLRIEDTYKKHPEIDEEQITKPLLVMGQPRTGTSFLLNTLSQDPHNGTTKTWEAIFPCPPPEKATYLTDPRIAKADKSATLWNRVAPELVSMHEFNGEVPTESVHVQSLSFISGWLEMLGQVPSYHAYVSSRSIVPAYRYEKRVLKLLQWKNPRRHWVLKTPNYIYHMPEALEVYPDAYFIWTHRDPIKALSSTVSLMGTINWTRSDQPFLPGSFDYITRADIAAALMSQPIDWLERNVVPRAQLCNVQYGDLMSNPMGVVERIYAHCGITLTEEGRRAIQSYLDAHPRSSRPAHKYGTGPDSLVSEERLAFKRYQDYFDVPSEL